MIDTTLLRILGACFYYSPQSETLKNLFPVLPEIPTLYSWQDAEQIQELCTKLSAIQADEISYDYSILFEGQGSMPAPPWGSVYLEHDNTVMGESTAEYRNFLQSKGLVTNTGVREPEDQFGLIMMAISALAEQGQEAAITVLFEQHLLPWAYRYLALVQQSKTETLFYPCLAQITEIYLKSLQQELGLSPAKVELFR
ncbi:molecular chaperone [Providencia rettgeri]|uniref:TorD/DmsD family molecular chaperone n=1 Tax=Providencia TaxID=586 RepID=UPI00065E0420|nr:MULTISPECIES: molecular chaperone [Providencia]EJD6044062.1 molecular chaperone [Providencia rettgeri]EJD6670352.1 molecular chaperone [Providencia rettgeri]ELR5125341.1 molecular chaperone [Providencia rettgeri]ELR5175511.1 molecular chaperone [Providencia rettgeri]ELR5211894.1 molecular chaperone [Providencia rettgeri]